MSTFNIFGFFALANARRVSTSRQNARTQRTQITHHYHYMTSIQCANGQALPADLRVYSPTNDQPHRDNTVVFIIAKVHTPAHSNTLLDAFYVIPFPGDPMHEEYENGMPDMPIPLIWGVGHVATNPDMDPDGKTRVLTVAISEYVRDAIKDSTIQCTWDTSSPRWANTPVPNVNTCVHFFGVCNALTSTGMLRLYLDNITLNLGPSSTTTPGGNTPSSSSRPASKQRKYNAIVPVSPFESKGNSSMVVPNSASISPFASLATLPATPHIVSEPVERNATPGPSNHAVSVQPHTAFPFGAPVEGMQSNMSALSGGDSSPPPMVNSAFPELSPLSEPPSDLGDGLGDDVNVRVPSAKTRAGKRKRN